MNNKKRYNFFGKKVEISDYHEINENDNLSSVNVVVNFSPHLLPKTKQSHKFSVGLYAFHYNNKFGTFNFNYSFPFYKTIIGINYFSSDKSILKHQVDLSYQFPIFKHTSHKKRYINAVNEKNSPYIIYTKTALINKLNLRLSIVSNYSNYYSSGYTKYLYSNNNFSSLEYQDSKNYAEISQKNNTLNFGLSFQNLLNTKFNAIDKEKHTYKAKTSLYTNTFFELSYLVGTNTNMIEYTYSATIDNSPSQNYTDIVDPKIFINKKTLGFRIGYEGVVQTVSSILFVPTNYSFEFGSYAGYFNKVSNSLYIKMSLKFGILKWH